MPEGTSSATASMITSILNLAMSLPICFKFKASIDVNMPLPRAGDLARNARERAYYSSASTPSVLIRNCVRAVLPSAFPA